MADTSDEIAPRLGARLPSVPLGVCAVTAAGCLVASVAFYWILLFEGPLHGYDWQSHHWNYFDWVRTSLRGYGTLPLFMNDAWVTKNFLANAEAPSLGPLVWLLAFTSTGGYIKLLIVLFSAAGLGGMVLLLRDLGVDPWVAAPGAAMFAFGGFFVSHFSVGHPWAMGGQVLPLLLFWYRRGALGSNGCLLAAAALNAFTIGGGQHQPFIWQNLLLGSCALAWAVRVRGAFPLVRGGLLLLATLAIGAVKLLPMWAEFAEYDPTARVPGLPLGLALWTVVGRGQGPELEVAGLEFDHGSGWWEYAFYAGPLAVAYLLAGALAVRRAWALVAIGLFFFVLAIEWTAPFGWLGVWSWLEGLPVWRTQRGPSRFLFVALFLFTVVGALGAQQLFTRWSGSRPRLAAFAMVGFAVALAVDCLGESVPWQREAVGMELLPGDHRPKPLRLRGTQDAVAELVGFEPNRLVYQVSAPAGGRVVFPFRLGEGTREWRVDGLPARSQGGKLALDLPPGDRRVAMRYRPEYFHLGAATSITSVVACAAWGMGAAWRRRKGR